MPRLIDGRRRSPYLLGAATALVLLSGATSAQAALSVYVTNYGDGTVSQYTIGAGEQLVPGSPQTVRSGKDPAGITVSPDAKNVYVANRGANTVSQFAIDAEGQLQPLSPAHVRAGRDPEGITTSADGQSVYVTDSGSDNVAQYDVGPGGGLSPKPDARVRTGHGPSEIAATTDGASVFVTNSRCYKPGQHGCRYAISQYNIGAGGALIPRDPPRVGGLSHPTALAVSPVSRWVFTTGSCGASCYGGLQYLNGGSLTLRDPYGVKDRAFRTGASVGHGATVSPESHSLYVTNDQGVRSFNVGPDYGGIERAEPPGVAAGSDPQGLVVGPSGRSLYVANRGDDTISEYDVATEGSLSRKATAEIPTGSRPTGIAVTAPHLTATRVKSISGSQITDVAGTAFFTTTDSAQGSELWKSDGTPAGTRLVKRIGSNPSELTAVGDELFFTADDPTHGTELWRSDGTRAGTGMVTDINPGSAGSIPGNLTAFDGKLFFAADDGAHGVELWRSNGKAAGTRMVKDFAPGTPSSFPFPTQVRDKLFVFACSTAAGCAAVDWASLPIRGASNEELWTSDGSRAGTKFVVDLGDRLQYGFWSANGLLWFIADDQTYGPEPWRSDGTAAGTKPIDICPGSCGSVGFADLPWFPLASVGDLVFIHTFLSSASIPDQIWRSDGTPEGTMGLPDAEVPYEFPYAITNAGGTAYFAARQPSPVLGQSIWTSDGTPAGTKFVKEIEPFTGVNHTWIGGLTAVGDTAFFRPGGLSPGTSGGLWSSHGTAASTQPVLPGLQGTPTDVGGVGFFFSNCQATGGCLWKVVP